jgi:type II secretion system protein H
MTTSAIGSKRADVRDSFTLIELSIVVFIMAVVLAICIPTFVRSYNGAVLRETAQAFATTCQFARIQAVTQQKPATLHVDLSRQLFWVSQPGHSEESTIDEDQTLKTYEISKRVWLFSAERLDDVGRPPNEVQVAFYPNGTCDPVSIVLRGVEKGDAIQVTIDPVTTQAEFGALKM